MDSKDIKIYPKDHQLNHIVYDVQQHEYYNSRTDIFLNDDDISYWKLRPYSLIPNNLPSPLPPDYFLDWADDDK
jgi:hypothetical protein